MKKRIGAVKGESQKRVRKGARRCPCCGSAPCSCEKTCFCQELKGEMEDDDPDETGYEDEPRFSFVTYGEQNV
jgi:hypothetical protein